MKKNRKDNQRHAASRCVQCKKKLDASSVIDDDHAVAKPEDFTVCLYCGELMRFKEDMTLRRVSENEMRLAVAAGHIDLEEIKRTQFYTQLAWRMLSGGRRGDA